jgi:MoxR-like ATPase
LPEAQLDRFLMHVRVAYPDVSAEKQILELARAQARSQALNDVSERVLLTQAQIFSAQQEVLSLHMAPAVEEYLVQLLLASRNPAPYGDDLARWISYGASPRGTIALDRCARAQAWLQGRDYVTPEDIQAVVFDTLRHRILLSFEGEAEGITSDDVIHELVRRVPVS